MRDPQVTMFVSIPDWSVPCMTSWKAIRTMPGRFPPGAPPGHDQGCAIAWISIGARDSSCCPTCEWQRRPLEKKKSVGATMVQARPRLDPPFNTKVVPHG